MNGLSQTGIMVMIFSFMGKMLGFMTGIMADPDNASPLSHASASMGSFFDTVSTFGIFLGPLLVIAGFVFGSFASNHTVSTSSKPTSLKTSHLETSTNNISPLIEVSHVEVVNSPINQKLNQEALVPNLPNEDLMNPLEKIEYYLSLIHEKEIAGKTHVILDKYHFMDKTLEKNALLVGFKEDNEKILTNYLPKILKNHLTLKNSLNVDNTQEKAYIQDTLYQLDILEKGLDHMINIHQSNIEDEASVMRLFLEQKFSNALPKELNVVSDIEIKNLNASM